MVELAETAETLEFSFEVQAQTVQYSYVCSQRVKQPDC